MPNWVGDAEAETKECGEGGRFRATLVGRQMVQETLLATVDEGGMKCSVREMQLLFPGSPSRDLL